MASSPLERRAAVRLVKTIGDAVMLVWPERTRSALAHDLVDAADAQGHDFPQLRAGMAAGAALSRAATGTAGR